ncbi:MAG: hypothetical protein DRI28_04290 [Caldiserica bacterium]|nr:MAG: hypothetical protein DRI28_04290 [Caldisericota bacterium]
MEKTLRGKKTKEKILESAIVTFKENGFKNASIKKIAERIGLSNASIYRYFKNKEEIYFALVKRFEDGLVERIEKEKRGKNALKLIKSILLSYINYISENTTLYDIFREVEFVNKDLVRDFYKKTTNEIEDVLKDKVKKNIDLETLSFSILGSVYFIVINYLIWDNKEIENKKIEAAFKLIERGIDRKGDFKPYIVKEREVEEKSDEILTKGEETKRKILSSAEKLFGERGYSETQMMDIARESRIGLGTIYLYFNSKKEILWELVKYINYLLRKRSWEYTKNFDDRREIENAGFQAFFHLFRNIGNDYRIVREAEFVDREIGAWYYKRLLSPYKKGLGIGMKFGEIIKTDPEALALSLMGIGHCVGMKWFVLEESKEMSKKVTLTTLNFIMHGLKGVLKEEV